MQISHRVLEAVQDVKRARLALKQAQERLVNELPEDVANDIHYNGLNAQAPAVIIEALITK